MSDDKTSGDSNDKSWLDKIALLFSGEPRTKEDLHDVLTVASENELIDKDALSIIEGAMQVSDLHARDIMIPRAQMVVVKEDATLEELLPQIIESAHSRFPVIGENTDEVLGILLAKDLLPRLLKSDTEPFAVAELMRPCFVVPESKRLNVLLREFRQNRNHMAIVIDEYGGVAGLITIEDVLEEIVGEIEDETDTDEDEFIRKITDTEFFVKALTPIEDFNEYFETQLSDEEFDTIGGLVIQAFGHMPARGETTTFEGFRFKVIHADQRKIQSLRVSKLTS
ncbi:MAG: HlyC/CorC family transporter [Aequoribacter sp.]|jgi:magnesium and cobalt transporter|uniref:HlyC/CorC family transporter n=1 Tax=Aequoribacter sp. TaxID=2847771 RepID=UPI003C539591